MKALTVRQPWASLIVHGPKWRSDAFARLTARLVAVPVPPGVDVEGDCWEFTGSRQERGHGLIRVGSARDGSSRLMKAHRLAYEALVCELDESESLDHLCQNPPCVNPAHLDPCTRGENVRREADRRTVCRRGHPWTAGNIVQLGEGRRTCGICLREALDRKNARKRARRAAGEVVR